LQDFCGAIHNAKCKTFTVIASLKKELAIS
jgi:hypothetical protein